MKEPSFLMVLTGTGQYAYRRSDGVYVVPLGCLKDWSSIYSEFWQFEESKTAKTGDCMRHLQKQGPEYELTRCQI